MTKVHRRLNGLIDGASAGGVFVIPWSRMRIDVAAAAQL